jgi:predicted acyltransferase
VGGISDAADPAATVMWPAAERAITEEPRARGDADRWLALDVFRGLTIALMIVVNDPGSWDHAYPSLQHSAWNGCTPTDMVFPCFLFIIGAAMWHSYKPYDHTLSRALLLKILRRGAVIYALGLALNAWVASSLDPSSIRIMGILPRIALGYTVASVIVLRFRVRTAIAIAILILVAYWAALLVFGGDDPYSLHGNLDRRFDIAVLGEAHVPKFRGVRFDQTGLLGTAPSIVNIVVGYAAGRSIGVSSNRGRAARALVGFGMVGIAAGLLWSLVLPLNKPLWTSSFAVLTCGIAAVVLGALTYLVDVLGVRRWTQPLTVFGRNSLAMYVLSEAIAITFARISIARTPDGDPVSVTSWAYDAVFRPIAGSLNGSLLYAIAFTTMCWLIGWLMYRARIFVKV